VALCIAAYCYRRWGTKQGSGKPDGSSEHVQATKYQVRAQTVGSGVSVGVSHGDINIVRQVEDKKTPDIRLVKVTTEPDEAEGGLKSRVNVVLKNNGSRSAVLLRGLIVRKGSATVTDCNRPRYSLTVANWNYDVDIETDDSFVGRHYLQPNEVESFNVVFGRAHGGPLLSVYRLDLRLEFDEDIPPIVVPRSVSEVSRPCTNRGIVHTRYF